MHPIAQIAVAQQADAERARLQQRLKHLEEVSLPVAARNALDARSKMIAAQNAFETVAVEALELRQMLDLPPQLAVCHGRAS